MNRKLWFHHGTHRPRPRALKITQRCQWISVAYGYDGSILSILWTNMKHPPHPQVMDIIVLRCAASCGCSVLKKRTTQCVFLSADLDLIITVTLSQSKPKVDLRKHNTSVRNNLNQIKWVRLTRLTASCSSVLHWAVVSLTGERFLFVWWQVFLWPDKEIREGIKRMSFFIAACSLQVACGVGLGWGVGGPLKANLCVAWHLHACLLTFSLFFLPQTVRTQPERKTL